MSCYGWERGSVQLPVKEWKSFRDNIYSRYNQKLQGCYELALKVYEEIKINKKGKRNYPLQGEVCALIYKLDSSSTSYYYANSYFQWLIEKSLIKNGKLVKPKKKDFAPKKPNKDLSLHDQELQVSFDNKSRTISYRSDDNNHSIDAAEEGFLGSLVLSLLNRVNFTSKTGGYFKKQTEYDTDAGEGASVSRTYGKYKTSKKYRRSVLGW